MAKGNASVNVSINGEEAKRTYGDLLKLAVNLNKKLKELVPGTEDFVAKSAELKSVRERIKGISDAANVAKKSMVETQKSMTVLKTIMSVFSGISLAGMFQQFIGLGRRVVDTQATFERFEAVLTNALGSRSAARQALDQLQQFADTTPFQIDELTDSYVKLVNRGFKPTQDQLTQIGDLAASQGKSFDQLVEAILDAQTGEFERLKEFGVRAKTVGDQVTLSFKGQSIQVAKTDEAIRNAVLGFGQLQGVAGSMEAVSKTLGGQLSNLADNVTGLFRAMGESGLGKAVSSVVSGLNRLVGRVKDSITVTDDQTRAVRTEQAEMNVLFETLKNGNFTQEERGRLIGEINSKYAEYLPNLIDEKASIDEIAKAQTAANNLLEQKIIYIALEKEIAAVLKRSAEAADGAFKAEKARQENAQKLANDLSLEDSRQIDALKGQQDLLGVLRDEQLQLVKDTPEQVQQIEATYDELAKRLGTTIAAIRAAFAPKPEQGGPGGGGPTDKEIEAQRKKYQAELDKIIELGLAANEQADKAAAAEAERLAAELTAIVDQYTALGQADMDYAEAKEEVRRLIHEAGTDDRQLELEEINAYYDDLIRQAEFYGLEVVAFEEARSRKIQEINQRDAMLAQRQLEDKIQIYSDLGVALGDFLSADEKARKKHADAIKAFEIGSILANLYAEIQGYYKGTSTYGAIGPVLASVLSATATVRAFAAVRRVSSQQFAGGGYTGPGGDRDSTGHRVAGVVHNDEWVAPKWMTEGSATAPVIRALEGIRRRGFADGGFTGPNTTPAASVAASALGDSQLGRLQSTLDDLSRAIGRMPQRVKAEVVFQDIETAGQTLEDIRGLASL